MIADMNKLYGNLIDVLEEKLQILPDKPEETAESTLRALWYLAAGEKKSADASEGGELPVLDSSREEMLSSYISQRLDGVPLAHITGRQQFMGIEFLVGPDALVPRKETEMLGNAALKKARDCAEKNEQVNVVDLCTGVGNIAIALAKNVARARVFAADLSNDAVSAARKNIEYHDLNERVEARESDLLHAFDNEEFHGQVDVLTCNPPYISSSKVEAMDQEISNHEPRLAFDGGPFGIGIVEKLIREAPQYLKKGGWLVFEIGLGQGPAFQQRIKKSGSYSKIESVEDENGNTRVLMARL